ncbi:MAG: 30S ribosomal protein S13 [Candidatus Marsarchaeota archaeon]|nr:30S ribosomal protein S13 [Candidatus Marsarchaeota archaeon]
MAENKRNRQSERSEHAHAQSIVRIAGKDVDGALSMGKALFRIKGVGLNLSKVLSLAIEEHLKIPEETQIGSLTDEQMASVEKVIKNPMDYGIPRYMLNSRRNMELGKDMHYVGNDLMFSIRQDINREINNKTWRGHRHQYGQRVRGQHTRSTGRTGATVGVTKKAAQKTATPAAASAKPAPAKK